MCVQMQQGRAIVIIILELRTKLFLCTLYEKVETVELNHCIELQGLLSPNLQDTCNKKVIPRLPFCESCPTNVNYNLLSRKFNLSDNLNFNGKYSIWKLYFWLNFSQKIAFSEKQVSYIYVLGLVPKNNKYCVNITRNYKEVQFHTNEKNCSFVQSNSQSMFERKQTHFLKLVNTQHLLFFL